MTRAPGASDPDWWRGACVYQIYPRSFCDSRGDGVGDLPGLISKLDYVSSLGVDAIWVCPFYRSPMADFGYDVSDHCDVDPIFGNLSDADALIEAAHARGLKIILDQVYSHTSDQHPWFAASRASREGEKADWYVWAEPRDGHNGRSEAPNNWLSVFGGPAWSFEPARGQYYLHNFLAAQPDLNFHNPAVRDAALDIAAFWLDRGVDGFRLDVANYYVHDANLRDNPDNPVPADPNRPYRRQRHVYDRSRPETIDFLKQLRALLDKRPGAMAVGEIFSDAYVERAIEYTAGADRLHTAYSFFFLENAPLSGKMVRDALEPFSNADAWPSWSFSNHDVVRAVSRWGGRAPQTQLAKQLLTLLACLRGTIFLYQGEELGLPHGEVPFEKLQDPEARASWPNTLGRDGARTPMPWRAEAPNAGFSNAEPWLPIDPRHVRLAVDRQEADPASTLAHARRVLKLRGQSPALRLGKIEFLHADEDTLMFERRHEDERVICAFNFSIAEKTLTAPEGELRPIDLGAEGRLTANRLELEPFGTLLLQTP